MLLDNPLTIDDFPHEAQCIGAPPCIYYGNLFENPTFYIRMIIFAYNSKIPGYNQIYSIYYSSHPYTCLYIYIHNIISVHSQSYIYICSSICIHIFPSFPICFCCWLLPSHHPHRRAVMPQTPSGRSRSRPSTWQCRDRRGGQTTMKWEQLWPIDMEYEWNMIRFDDYTYIHSYSHNRMIVYIPIININVWNQIYVYV